MLSLSAQHFRRFAARHDHMPAFHAVYLVATLIIAALLNVGAFAVLILAHASLDIVKYRDHHGLSWHKTFEGMARENLIDIVLLLAALTFSVYFEHSGGFMAGAGGLLRTEMTIIRGIFVLIPKFTILHNILCVLSNVQHYYDTINPRMGRRLQPVERSAIACGIATVVLLVVGPWVLHLPLATYGMTLLQELTPGTI